MDIKIEIGSSQGSRQAAKGTGTQDAYRVDCSPQGFCAVLTDGASSAACAAEGAGLVSGCVCALVKSEFSKLWEMENNSAAEVITKRLKTELELLAENKHIPVGELASTLIFAASDGERLMTGHLGDGVILGLHGGNIIVVSFPENDGKKGTYLTTSPQAGQHLRICKGSTQAHDGLVLLTDGLADRAFDKGYIPRKKAPLTQLLREATDLPHDDDASFITVRWR